MYIAGYNLAGCVSDPDSNYVTEDWLDAVTYIRETIESWWDSDYWIAEGYGGELLLASEKEEIDSRYLRAHTLINNDPTPPEFFAIAEDYAGNYWELWIVEAEGEID